MTAQKILKILEDKAVDARVTFAEEYFYLIQCAHSQEVKENERSIER